MTASRLAQAFLLLWKSIRYLRCFACNEVRAIPHDDLDAETGAWVYDLCEK